MDDLIFYWVAWLTWIWTTWIMDKNKQRLQVALIVLLAIIISSYSIYFFDYKVNTGVLFFLFLALYLLYKESMLIQLYLHFSSITIALGYVAIYLISVYDPISLILSFNFVAAVYLLFITSFFTKSFTHRLILLFIGTSLGEITIGVILKHLNLYNEIGMNHYLTRLTLTFIGILMFTSAKSLLITFERFVTRMNERKNVM